MRSKLAASAPAVAACVLLGGIQARATTIDIGVAQAPGIDNITTETFGPGSGVVQWAGPSGSFLVSAAASDPSPVDLASVTLDVSLSAGSGTLYVYVTETDLTSSQLTENFLSNLSVTSLPNGWQEIETTYVDSTNTAYGMQTQLASMTTSGSKSVNVTSTGPTGPAGSTFSLTEVYEFMADGFGLSTSEQSITGPAPDPAPAPLIGSGISSMLAVGGILLGWNLLERRRKS
jgi:hypothetical protein